MEYDNDIILDNNECLSVEENGSKRSRLPRRQAHQSKKICAKEERNASIKKVSLILQKSQEERSPEESEVLQECKETVDEIKERWRKREEAKRRLREFEDPVNVLNEKCQILAQAIAQSQHLVVYTGAGISTSAKIPDYRGPNGIWTKLQKGEEIGDHDLTLAKPTFTHMALSELYKRKILKYVVSQNCDGLHLRSGLPRTALSEVHGNMYIEVCKTCKPHREYWRLFDVTENTARYAHKTSRKCYVCNSPLIDTIVHFGERGSLQWPLNWQGAGKNAKSATTILCLGSSLKVLKKYPWLWQMDKPAKRRPNLYIVNLQWTPKDDCANVKIHGKCDEVMKIVMDLLGIDVPSYDETKDPIFIHATTLNELELHTTTQPMLKSNHSQEKKEELKNHDSECKEDTEDIKYSNNMEDCSVSNQFDLNHASTDFCSQNCDNSSNRKHHVETTSPITENQCLPLPRDANKIRSFSIDNILQCSSVQEDNISNTIPQESTQTYLNSFNAGLSLFLNHSIFGSYSDFLLYPYQTSFLYPGLHSIINPSPFFKDDFTISQQESTEKVEPSCSFCDLNYSSLTCLFYTKAEPIFKNEQYRYSKIEKKDKINICVCCDYTTEEEDLDESTDKDTNEKDIKNRIQAGWFGKGYKKYRKYKKKSV